MMETIGWLLIITLGVAAFASIWAFYMWTSAIGEVLENMTFCIKDLDEKNRKERLK